MPKVRIQPMMTAMIAYFVPFHPDESDDGKDPVEDIAEDGALSSVVRPAEDGVEDGPSLADLLVFCEQISKMLRLQRLESSPGLPYGKCHTLPSTSKEPGPSPVSATSPPTLDARRQRS